MMNKLLKKAPWKVLLIAVGIVILPFVFKPWAQIGAGQGGHVLNLGVIQNKTLGEGIHFKTPVSQPSTTNYVMIKSLEDYYHALAELVGKYSKTQEGKVTLNHNKEPDFQGYPPLEDIYQQFKKGTDVSPEDPSKMKM
jgi:hypothetical protein